MSKIVENDGKSWGNHEKNHGKWWRFDGNVENRKPNFSRPLIELRGAHTVCLQLTLVIDILWTARYWKYFETRIQFQFSLDWFKGKSKPETGNHRKPLSLVVKTMVSGQDVSISSQQNQSIEVPKPSNLLLDDRSAHLRHARGVPEPCSWPNGNGSSDWVPKTVGWIISYLYYKHL